MPKLSLAFLRKYFFFLGLIGSALGLHYWLLLVLPPNLLYFTSASIVLGVMIIILIAEKLTPFSPDWNHNRGDFWLDIFLTNISLPLIAKLVETILGKTVQIPFCQNLWPNHWPVLLQLGLALIICEFTFYWAHRWGHETRILWKFHSVHHSAARVYSMNSGRFHPIDIFIDWTFYFFPLFLFGVPQEVVALFVTLNGVTGLLEHANVDYWAPNLILNSADLHRWHHSVVISESSNNYGKVLCIWDRIFGTFFLPKDRVVQKVGVEE